MIVCCLLVCVLLSSTQLCSIQKESEPQSQVDHGMFLIWLKNEISMKLSKRQFWYYNMQAKGTLSIRWITKHRRGINTSLGITGNRKFEVFTVIPSTPTQPVLACPYLCVCSQALAQPEYQRHVKVCKLTCIFILNSLNHCADNSSTVNTSLIRPSNSKATAQMNISVTVMQT